jgi:Protein of unknown function (DUF3467)
LRGNWLVGAALAASSLPAWREGNTRLRDEAAATCNGPMNDAGLCYDLVPRVTLRVMNTAIQPNVKFVQTPDYREAYANSVQIRVNVWDFFLVFGTMQQSSETQAEMRNFQGIYLSPQQAKALTALLQQNVANYESAFGEIKLDPRTPGGPVH